MLLIRNIKHQYQVMIESEGLSSCFIIIPLQ